MANDFSLSGSHAVEGMNSSVLLIIKTEIFCRQQPGCHSLMPDYCAVFLMCGSRWCVCVCQSCVCVVEYFVRGQDWATEQELVHVNRICSVKDVPFAAEIKKRCNNPVHALDAKTLSLTSRFKNLGIFSKPQ